MKDLPGWLRSAALRARCQGKVLRVVDRGSGFSHDPDRPAVGHPGIDAMRRHVEGIGGKMGIISAPGMGTTVELQLPIGQDWIIA